MENKFSNKVAIIGGVRTPFCKAGTKLAKYSMQELGENVLSAAWKKFDLKECSLDEVVFSSVLLDPRTPNWAREMVFSAGYPKTVYADSLSNNCISGLVAITRIAERIALGKTNAGIGGGVESMSRPTLVYKQNVTDVFLALARARSFKDKMRALKLGRIGPRDFLPPKPSVSEPSTGLSMGEHMEITAKELAVARDKQDEIAYNSHINASRAMDEGILSEDIETIGGVSVDSMIRSDTTLEKLAGLRTVFDRSESATLTAGNSSGLTDGASCVFLTSLERAASENREVLASIADYEYCAIDPADGLLMAPGVCVPRLLKRNGLTFSDCDIIEIHEAFGAQVLANAKAWAEGWKEPAVGSLDWDRVNVNGGSIAIGHPFAATGGRIVLAAAKELKRRNAKRALISICAAGAMAGAMLIERN